MAKRRKQYSNQSKLKVALDAIKKLQTINEIVSSHGVHLSQVKTWKKQLLTEWPTLFGNHTAQHQRPQDVHEAELYEQIRRLKMELEWLKKSAQFCCLVFGGHHKLSLPRIEFDGTYKTKRTPK